MAWTGGIDDGGWGEFGYGNVAEDAAVAAIGEAMAGEQGMGGYRGGPSSQSGEDSRDESNDPTFNFTSGQPLGPQIAQQNAFTNALKSAMTAMVPGLGMMQGFGRVLGSFVGNPPNEMMTQNALNQGLMSQFSNTSLATPMGHPHRDNMMSVPMSGSGAQLGIATARDPTTGLNMGPGRPGEPGDVNPFSGIAYADPPDPYIRKRRGTEIAAMIGP